MKFGFDTIISSISDAFSTKRNKITILHFLVIAAIWVAVILLSTLLSLANAMLGMALGILLAIPGALLTYYVLVRVDYVMTGNAINELKGQSFDYGSVKAQFAEQKWTALLFPIILGLVLTGIYLVVVIIESIFGFIPVVGPVLNAIIFVPAFLVCFFFILLIAFGQSVSMPIIYDNKFSIGKTIKAVIVTIIKRFQSLLIYNVLASVVLGTLYVFIFVLLIGGIVLALAPQMASMAGSMMGGGYNSFSAAGPMSLLMGSGNLLSMVILLAGLAVIFAFIGSIIFNIVIGIKSAIYLAVREGLDFDAKLSVDPDKVKQAMKE